MISQENIIKLTHAIYQVTDKFPKNESLKQKIREKANDILADFINFNPRSVDKQKVSGNIKVLLAYFMVAEKQEWVDKKNFLVLSQEYGKLKKFIQEFSPQIPVKQAKIVKKAEISEKNRENSSMKLGLSPLSRQKKIVEMIKSKGEVSLSELRDTFSNVTSRTLRRDLSSLLDKNMIERIRNGKEEVLFTGPKI